MGEWEKDIFPSRCTPLLLRYDDPTHGLCYTTPNSEVDAALSLRYFAASGLCRMGSEELNWGWPVYCRDASTGPNSTELIHFVPLASEGEDTMDTPDNMDNMDTSDETEENGETEELEDEDKVAILVGSAAMLNAAVLHYYRGLGTVASDLLERAYSDLAALTQHMTASAASYSSSSSSVNNQITAFSSTDPGRQGAGVWTGTALLGEIRSRVTVALRTVKGSVEGVGGSTTGTPSTLLAANLRLEGAEGAVGAPGMPGGVPGPSGDRSRGQSRSGAGGGGGGGGGGGRPEGSRPGTASAIAASAIAAAFSRPGTGSSRAGALGSGRYGNGTPAGTAPGSRARSARTAELASRSSTAASRLRGLTPGVQLLVWRLHKLVTIDDLHRLRPIFTRVGRDGMLDDIAEEDDEGEAGRGGRGLSGGAVMRQQLVGSSSLEDVGEPSYSTNLWEEEKEEGGRGRRSRTGSHMEGTLQRRKGELVSPHMGAGEGGDGDERGRKSTLLDGQNFALNYAQKLRSECLRQVAGGGGGGGTEEGAEGGTEAGMEGGGLWNGGDDDSGDGDSLSPRTRNEAGGEGQRQGGPGDALDENGHNEGENEEKMGKEEEDEEEDDIDLEWMEFLVAMRSAAGIDEEDMSNQELGKIFKTVDWTESSGHDGSVGWLEFIALFLIVPDHDGDEALAHVRWVHSKSDDAASPTIQEEDAASSSTSASLPSHLKEEIPKVTNQKYEGKCHPVKRIFTGDHYYLLVGEDGHLMSVEIGNVHRKQLLTKLLPPDTTARDALYCKGSDLVAVIATRSKPPYTFKRIAFLKPPINRNSNRVEQRQWSLAHVTHASVEITPSCLAYHHGWVGATTTSGQSTTREEILCFGDEEGGVYCGFLDDFSKPELKELCIQTEVGDSEGFGLGNPGVTSILYAPAISSLVVGSDDGLISVVGISLQGDLADRRQDRLGLALNGGPHARFEHHKATVASMVWNAESELVASCGSGHAFLVWDPRLPSNGPVSTVHCEANVRISRLRQFE